MKPISLIPVRALMLGVGIAFAAGCSNQRTVTTNMQGARIPASVLEALQPGMTAEDWLILQFGAPDHRETDAAGQVVLTWTYVRHTQEHRPDPHEEEFTQNSYVQLGADGQVVRAWFDEHDERLN